MAVATGRSLLRRVASAWRQSQCATFTTDPVIASIREMTPDEKIKKFFYFDRTGENSFRQIYLTTGGQLSKKSAYGGLIMGQALAAAEATVAKKYKPHSIHAYFILSVDPTVPVEYNVRILRNGRSFMTRSVEAIQKGSVVFSLQASFNTVEPESCVHQVAFPRHVRPACECEPYMEAATKLIDQIQKGEIHGSEHTREALAKYSQVDRTNWLFDFRCTDTAALFGLGEPSEKISFWMKCKLRLHDDERLHRWLLLFASDTIPYQAIVRKHTRNDFSVSMLFTIDHVMHFHHHDFFVDEWLLYEIESPKAASARGYARGRIWRTDGTLLASISQEALVRTKGDVSRLKTQRFFEQ